MTDREVLIDTETGFPALPEGYFWRVQSYQTSSYSVEYVKVSIMHEWIKNRLWRGPITKIDEIEYSLTSMKSFLDKNDEDRRFSLQICAEIAFKDFRHQFPTPEEIESVEAFYGDYPPKSL